MTSADPPDPDAPTESVEARAIAVERLTFFADAVVAIAITLLALDLPLPTGVTNGDLWRSMLDNFDQYLAFGISFLVIAARWNAHHRIFRYVTHTDGRLGGLTMGWLFTQVVTPFATRVITGDGGFQLRFGLYVLVQVVSSVLFVLMVREVQRHHLYRDDTPPDLFRRTYRREAGMTAGFLVSVPVSFVTVWAYACWAAGPVVLKTARRVRSAAA